MKNWLIAILGVSLAAISYTAYELELKSRPGPQVAKVMTADGTVIPQNNSAKTTPPAAQTAERAGQPIANKPSGSANNSAGAPSDSSEAKMPAPVAGTSPSATTPKSAMDENTKVVEETNKSAEIEMAARAPEPETSLVDKAKGLVSNLFGGDDETTVASAPKSGAETGTQIPDDKSVASDSAAKTEPSATTDTASKAPAADKPEGLMEQAIDAVSNLFAPEKTTEVSETAETTEAAKSPADNSAGENVSSQDAGQDAGKEIKTAARMPETAATPEPETPASGAVVEAQKTTDTGKKVPSFDVVRVERDGSAVIAGRAEPGAMVHLQSKGKSLGSAKASRRGEFVIIPDMPIPAGSSALSLRSELPDGEVVGSSQVVTVAVADENSDAETKVAIAAPTPVENTPAASSSASASAPETTTPTDAAASATATQAEKAPVPATQTTAPAEQQVAAVSQAETPQATTPQATTPQATAPAEAQKSVASSAASGKPASKQAASGATAAVKMPTTEMASNTGPAGANANTATTAAPDTPAVASKPGKGDGLADTQTAVIVGNQSDETATTEAQSAATAAAQSAVQSAAPAVGQPAPEKQTASASTTPTNPTNPVVSSPAASAAAKTPKAAESQVATVQTQPQTESSVAKPEVGSSAEAKPDAPEQKVAAVAPAANAPASGTNAANAGAASSERAASETTDSGATAPAAPASPLVVISEPGRPSRVLQGAKSKPKTPVTFETVDYDDDGKIILAGQVAPGADVRAYLGEAHLGDAKASADGQWVLRTTRDIDPGVYQLRVDKIDVGGQVVARVTAPFERASPDAVARVRANGEVIIQPGDNLWNISRAVYGTGTQYTVIYDANRNQISDADLIFPGQVFMTPGAPDASTAKEAVQAQSTSG